MYGGQDGAAEPGEGTLSCGKTHNGRVCLKRVGHLGPHMGQESVIMAPETELKGGRVNYYLVRVEHPQREDQPPYTAECEDIIDGLELTPDEANIFKEIWRSANARKGNGKPDHKALYGAQKIVHYAGRILRKLSRAA